MNYEFHPAAKAEFLESVGFYESRVQGLGNAFIEEFEVAIDLVCEHQSNGRLRGNLTFAAPHFIDFHYQLSTERSFQKFKCLPLLMTEEDHNIGSEGLKKDT